MRTAERIENAMIDLVAASLNGGALVILSGSRPQAPEKALDFQQELARIPLPSPAFNVAVGRQAMGHELPETEIAVSGEASWAQLVTAAGRVVSDLLVRTQDADDADEADVIVDRIDLQRGGKFKPVTPLILTLTSSS